MIRAMAADVHGRTCPICDAMCGVTIPVDAAGRIGTIRGDRDDPWSKGFICPKGASLGKLHADPDRLRAPLVRSGDTFREVSWPEAYARCEELIHGVLERHGIDGFATYVGNQITHNFSLARYSGAVIASVPRMYSAGTIDTWPRNVASVFMYGNAWFMPVPDLERTDYFLCLGANPQASNGSLFVCPDIVGKFDEIRGRGGKVVVVDPRRTGTAARADEWLPIRPGTDAAFLLAILQVLFAENRVTLGMVSDLVDGLEAVQVACASFTPERVEGFTGIPSATIRRIALELSDARSAAVYGRVGLCNQEFGTLASWLTDVVAICTGNLDRVGGLMFPKPIQNSLVLMGGTRDTGMPQFGRWQSRVRGAPEILGQVPLGLLTEEIATPGPGQVKGLIVIAGNPVVAVPESDKLDAALPLLECMISLDCYLNESSRHAHVVLPGPSPLETPYLDASHGTYAVRSVARWSEPLFPRPDGMPDEWETLLVLQGLLAGKRLDEIDIAAADDAMFARMCGAAGVDPGQAASMTDARGPERIADWAIRTGPFGDRYGEDPDGWDLARLKQQPHGVDLGPMVPSARVALSTPDGHVDLAPAYVLADLPRLEARMQDAPDDLVLIERRHVRSMNSWMHNIEVLVKGKDRCTLLVHPEDADRFGLRDGEPAEVRSEVGAVTTPVEVSDGIMPGVVSLPHGWGHGRPGSRQSVAREHPGVNCNPIVPLDRLDVPSGNCAANGVPVQVAPVAERR
jgi:anaerobic selenocysteine-containing dehydrogenase